MIVDLRERYPDMPALLKAIRESPGMFLGQRSSYGLQQFLLGIRFAEDIHEVSEDERIGGFPWSEFEAWIADRFNQKRLSLNSFSLVAHFVGSDVDGFEQWFQWYDEFVGMNNMPLTVATSPP